MNFDPNDMSMTPNERFRTNVVYEGRGRAEFEDPGGCVDRSLFANEYAESSVQMTIETVASDRELQFGSMEFFSGEKLVEDRIVSLPLTFKSKSLGLDPV